MRTLFITLITIFVSAGSFCQTSESHKKRMKIFEGWVGEWKGEGQMRMGPGKPKTSTISEKIEMKLDSTILVVEGMGTSIDVQSGKEIVVHHALGILSYDASKNCYQFKTYLKDGKSSDAWFNVTSENNYQWGFDVPNGKIRYTVTINAEEQTWLEIGEYLNDGATWLKFFEMNLKKI